MNELLTTRFEVIADYPNAEFKVGQIITPDVELYKASDLLLCYPSVEKYPHLFRKLEWWEARQESEMPRYVSAYRDGKKEYYKVDSWRYSINLKVMITDFYLSAADCQPLSEQEYLNQTKG